MFLCFHAGRLMTTDIADKVGRDHVSGPWGYGFGKHVFRLTDINRDRG